MSRLRASRARPDRPLRIVHVLRAPLGGLFRHVVDLAEQQMQRGHHVGLVADSMTGGPAAAQRLAALNERLALGTMRLPIHRLPHAGDIAALWKVGRHLARLQPDVVHGHGAKGGLLARLPGALAAGPIVRAYTPHGGSFNYRPGTLSHRAFMAAEAVLARGTDLLLFESDYIAACYDAGVGPTRALRRTIVNGLDAAEFLPVPPAPNAADLLYVGELRSAKGIDTLIDALAHASTLLPRAPNLVLVGSGPDKEQLERQARGRGVADRIRFAGPLPARTAFALGRVLVVPSRAESLPYVVLEAAAARMPMIATRVGGIPEIFGPSAGRLIASDNPVLLAAAIAATLAAAPATLAHETDRLATFVASRFTLRSMADGVLAGYADALARKTLLALPRTTTLPLPS